MKLTTLYKRNSRGSAQQWSIFVDGGKFWAEYGLVDGAIQSDEPTICQGKNLGKKNETTPEQQALLEAESKIKKQKDKGYSESLETQGLSFTPMLSHEFGKHGAKLPNEVFVSPKLDGLRMFINKEGGFSRNGKPFVSARFIYEDLSEFFEKHPEVIIDGEIYNHRFKEDFNKIVSLAKKSVKISESDWNEISELLQYHIFDFFFPKEPNLSFEDRFRKGKLLIKNHTDSTRIHFVQQRLVTKGQVDEAHENYLQEGYEGIMIRDPKSPYQQKRSYFLQKYKNFIDEEFEVIDIQEGKGNWAGKAMKVLCLNEDSQVFEAVPKGTEEYRAQLLLDKAEICGKMATVKYQNRTPDNKPRFGIVTAIRDYE